MSDPTTGNIRVTVWNEGRHEKTDPQVAAVYPESIHGALANHLRAQPGFVVRTARPLEPVAIEG
jgi:trehalose utilization protein